MKPERFVEFFHQGVRDFTNCGSKPVDRDRTYLLGLRF